MITRSAAQSQRAPAAVNADPQARALGLPEGYELDDGTVIRRMIISVSGLDKQGKSSFALSAPGPIGYMNIDRGLEGVSNKFVQNKDIWRKEYRVPVHTGQLNGTRASDKDLERVQEMSIRIWGTFVQDYLQMAQSKLRTIVWDTATEAWELIRMARLGKLSQVMPTQYTAVNSEFRDLIRLAHDRDFNLILLHKMKEEWVEYTDSQGRSKSRPAGTYRRAGFGDTGFEVQVNAESYYEAEKRQFHLYVVDCRQNMDIAGDDYTEPDNDFTALALKVFPDSRPEEWE